MIPRRARGELLRLLEHVPAVVLLGPRQVGKTTLALDVSTTRPSVYVDLESPSGLARIAEPELYLADHENELVILDEVHRAPGLFHVLRGVIDQGRQAGRPNGRFLLLGSASTDLLRQSGETLAGRVTFLELDPVRVTELSGAADDLWIRGGFPGSVLAPDDAISFQWRRDFIRTYLERDVPQFSIRIPAETLRRFWTMLAHGQGGLLNAAHIGRSLGVDATTVARYVDLLVDLLLVRRLTPWTSNVGKRLVRSPKIYVRDSGLVHALLGLDDREAVLGHQVAGASWEGFVIENILASTPSTVSSGFYRSIGGAEVDLILGWPDGKVWLIEIKRTLAPALGRGFWSAWNDLEPDRGLVVYPGSERFHLKDRCEAISLTELADELTQSS